MFSWFFTFVKAVNMIVWLGAIGFATGAISLFAGRIFSGLKAYAIAGSIGAILVLGTYWTGMIDTLASNAAKEKIASLEAEKAKLSNDLELVNAVLAKEREHSAELLEINAANETVLEKLNSIIASHEGDPYCGAFVDELEALGEIK